jgi:hypothetical protein
MLFLFLLGFELKDLPLLGKALEPCPTPFKGFSVEKKLTHRNNGARFSVQCKQSKLLHIIHNY